MLTPERQLLRSRLNSARAAWLRAYAANAHDERAMWENYRVALNAVVDADAADAQWAVA